VLAFLGYIAAYIALFALCALPAILVARRHRYRYPDTPRRFLIGAVVAGTFCGVEHGLMARLERICRSNGNTRCWDSGGAGLVALIVIVFLATSLVRAWLIHSDD
jgi:hypothetical protein